MDSEVDRNIAKLRGLTADVGALGDGPESPLDPKTDALVRVAALVALGATPSSYAGAIRGALAVGASPDEIVGTLESVGATVGIARVVSASGAVAVALGYDIDAAFEEH
jgi:alkylhydroperoxidase/carboxymuconolactone decarboxylase family protein YurZ